VGNKSVKLSRWQRQELTERAILEVDRDEGAAADAIPRLPSPHGWQMRAQANDSISLWIMPKLYYTGCLTFRDGILDRLSWASLALYHSDRSQQNSRLGHYCARSEQNKD